jgi:hypothetical protein
LLCSDVATETESGNIFMHLSEECQRIFLRVSDDVMPILLLDHDAEPVLTSFFPLVANKL